MEGGGVWEMEWKDVELEHHFFFQGLLRYGTLNVTSPIFDTFCYLFLRTCVQRKLKKDPMSIDNFEDH